MSEETQIAPLTEEQWERIINWYRKKSGREIIVQGLLTAKEFQASMNKIHSLAGTSQEQLGEVSQALLDMA